MGASRMGLNKIMAGEDIKEGTVVWKFDNGIDMLYTDEEVSKASKLKQAQINKHAYYDEKLKVWVLCSDNAVFFNHSDNPTCREENKSENFQGRTISVQNIKKGEELTCDYFEFDGKAKEKLK